MNCENCNAQIEDGWLLCPSCGMDLSLLESENYATTPKPALTVGKLPSEIVNKNADSPPPVSIGFLFFWGLVCLSVLAGILFLFKKEYFSKTSILTPNATNKPLITKQPDRTPSPTIPLITKQPSRTPSPTIPPLPTFTVRSYNDSTDGDLDVFWSNDYISNFSWHSSPGEYLWRLTYKANTPLLVNIGWCSLSQEILTQNLEVIKVNLIFDGYDITNRLDIIDGGSQMSGLDWVCKSYLGVIENISSGSHKLVYSQIFSQSLNDGMYDFEKGSYVEVFHITIP